MPIYFINIVRENQRGNQEWTFQRHGQHWTYKTQDEDKQAKNKKNTTHKTKNMSNTDPIKNQGTHEVYQFLLFIRHLLSYSYN
jgi:hypothetical protein